MWALPVIRFLRRSCTIMTRNIRSLLLGCMAVGGFLSSAIQAELAPARPQSVTPKSSVPLGASSPLQRSGRTTVITGRDRIGVTAGSGTTAFPATPQRSRPDNFLTQTRQFGDGTVVTGPSRIGVTRAVSTGNLGVSALTRAPQTVNRSGLSTLHSTGSVWSGFRRVK